MTAKHILIVDDEPKVRFFLGRSLQLAGDRCDVSTAQSGEEALRALRRSSVDLLVTDLRMPGINGLELIRQVRRISPETRTIIITAYGNDEVQAEARHLGVSHYITKPFDVDQFTRAVWDSLRARPSSSDVMAFSDTSFEALAAELEKLRIDLGAFCILLSDMLGQRIVEVGTTEGLDVTTLLTLLAGGFATTGELARQLGTGEEEAVNFNFHEGKRYEIYSASLTQDLFLVILYDRRVQRSRIGAVWHYTSRALETLKPLVARIDMGGMTEDLDEDFGASLMQELDALLGGEESPAPSPPPPKPRRPAPPAPRKARPSPPDDHRAEGSPPVVPVNPELLDVESALAQGLLPPEVAARFGLPVDKADD
jgi:CheY-like chemotaxis protein